MVRFDGCCFIEGFVFFACLIELRVCVLGFGFKCISVYLVFVLAGGVLIVVFGYFCSRVLLCMLGGG